MLVALVAACAVLVALTVALDHRGQRGASLACKAGASSCFMAIALTRPAGDAGWWGAIVAGLALGMVGDIALALPGRRAFLAGLVAFLLGHVAYVVAFAGVVPPSGWGDPAAYSPVLVSAAALAWLWPHAGAMRGPVVAYVLVITAMVVAAIAALPALAAPVGRIVLVGAVLFYASDLFVARHRFVAPGLVNRAVGLPLYYAGQCIIAWAAGAV